jgi:hypothetical protein
MIRMDQSIGGLFMVESDRDGTYYKVTFRPDVSQIWSAKPDGFVVTVNEQGHAAELIGERSEPFLSQARVEGFVEFHGRLSRDLYWRYASDRADAE